MAHGTWHTASLGWALLSRVGPLYDEVQYSRADSVAAGQQSVRARPDARRSARAFLRSTSMPATNVPANPSHVTVADAACSATG